MGGALRGRTGRSLLTVAGIGGTSLLVLVLLAALRSLSLGVNAYVGRPEVDLWVAPPGTDNLIRSSGFLPLSAAEDVRAVPGVERADPLLRSFVRVQPSGAPPLSSTVGTRTRPEPPGLTLLSVGFDAPSGLGGPPELASGRLPDGDGGVVIDRAAADRLDVRIGDTVLVNLDPTPVVGLSRGTNLLATQFLFGDIQSARTARELPGRSSFLAVQLAGEADRASVMEEIRARQPALGVYDRETFVANNLREVASGVRPMIALVAGLGVVVATVLVVLLVQGVVEDRHEDIAVLLALGSGVRTIGTGLVGRAALQVALGTVVGGGLAVGLGGLLDRVYPSVELSYTVSSFLFTVGIFLVAGCAAAVLPLLRLRRIDPLEAFRP